MKATEKIYIDGFSAFATEPIKDGIEYIRKDALLEWLKEELRNAGPTTLVQYIINKLNSL